MVAIAAVVWPLAVTVNVSAMWLPAVTVIVSCCATATMEVAPAIPVRGAFKAPVRDRLMALVPDIASALVACRDILLASTLLT